MNFNHMMMIPRGKLSGHPAIDDDADALSLLFDREEEQQLVSFVESSHLKEKTKYLGHISRAEDEVLKLIAKREKLLQWCLNTSHEEERARLMKKLRGLSSQVMDGIVVWQGLRNGRDFNSNFAWNGHKSYVKKMISDAKRLQKAFNVDVSPDTVLNKRKKTPPPSNKPTSESIRFFKPFLPSDLYYARSFEKDLEIVKSILNGARKPREDEAKVRNACAMLIQRAFRRARGKRQRALLMRSIVKLQLIYRCHKGRRQRLIQKAKQEAARIRIRRKLKRIREAHAARTIQQAFRTHKN